MPFLRKYGVATATGTHVGIPMPKAGSPDFAAGGDWTPATGDVKVGIDGGSQANITTLPAYTNGQWVFQLSAGEMTGKSVRVAVVDAATKAVDDNFVVVETYGHASALHPFDLGSAGVPLTAAGLDAVLVESGITAGAGLTNDTGTQLTAINARQALALAVSALNAVLTGAAGTAVTIKPAGKPASSDRVSAAVDASGNRTAVTLKVPD